MDKISPLRKLREKTGKSVTEMAAVVGVRQGQISLWELYGPPHPTYRLFSRYALALGVSEEALRKVIEEIHHPVRPKQTFGWLEAGEIFYFMEVYRKKEKWVEAIKTESGEVRGRYMVREGVDAGRCCTMHNDTEIEYEVDETTDDATDVSE